MQIDVPKVCRSLSFQRASGVPGIHVAAVIGHNQAVLLHGLEDHLIRCAVTGYVEACLEPEAAIPMMLLVLELFPAAWVAGATK